MGHATNETVNTYIAGVLDGSIAVNDLARLAFERQVGDLERWPCVAELVPGDHPDREEEIQRRAKAAQDLARVRGDEFYFDENAAQAPLDFYPLCRHVEGELAGQPFRPLACQAAVDWITHGWMRTETGTRRFTERWIEEPRGNGKSTWLAVHELYMLCKDGEPAAKVYAVATEKTQAASAVWGIAAEMIRQSPDLVGGFVVQDSFNNHRIFIPGTGCLFAPIKPDPKKADSLRAHSISADEIHAWPRRETYTKFKDATGKQREGMFTNITSAGDDRPKTLYDEQHDHAIRVLRGWRDRSFEDNAFFAVIFAIDSKNDGCEKDADAEDEAEWRKANPALGFPGTGVQLYYLRSQANRGKVDPEVLRDFLRFHLGRRIGAKTKAIADQQWKACSVLEQDADQVEREHGMLPAAMLRALQIRPFPDWSFFNGQPCFAALDLSSSRDLTAVSLYFPPGIAWPWETYRFFAWLPKDNLLEACERDHAPYDQWAREGWLELTEGDEIDNDVIFKRCQELQEKYLVVQWAYDPWHAVSLKNAMFTATGVEMIKFVQDLPSFGEPTRLFLDSIVGRKMRHDGNPLARWCAGNVVCKEDAHGNKRPHKGLSSYRIDPIVAAIMARGRAIVVPILAPPPPWDGHVDVW